MWSNHTFFYRSHDLTNMKIHMRKHNGERPFKCSDCNYGFYKKSDLTLHQKSCNGKQYNCSKCNEYFHFRSKLDHHLNWSESCGSIRDKIGSNPSSKSPMVRLNTNDSSIIGINCNEIVDKTVFVKRKKRSKCGICCACEVRQNCGKCGPCSRKTKKSRCVLRKCLNLIPQYDVKKNQEERAKWILQRLTNDNAIDDHTYFNKDTAEDDEDSNDIKPTDMLEMKLLTHTDEQTSN